MEHTFDRNYWDDIWKSAQATPMSGSAVNPHLVEEINDLTPGTALEAGCGAGTEAIWLAERGWLVTGVDIVATALAVAADRAEARGVADRVDWLREDLSSWEPTARYDLVTTHYAHPAIPQLDFYERIATWVAPGGTLFIVGHLHHHDPTEHQREPGGSHGGGNDDHSLPPIEATATAAAITDRLATDVWEVLTAEESHRTMTGSGGRQAQIHDVVVRARRRT